jgi:uncharacterized flavoprotein (TIGR03862 family)
MSEQASRSAAIIGGGPAGLMAAEILARVGVAVTIYDRMASLGRKFLLAGRGGLNLTHSEPLDGFIERYREAAPALRGAIEAFSPEDLRAFSAGLGQETFVGSSGRVFPAGMKTSPLLRAWLRRLAELGVAIRPRYCWTGWTEDGALTFTTPDGMAAVRADCTILALGGASWPHLGSDGGWTSTLGNADISLSPLRPSNCGFRVSWSEIFRDRFAGQPLKNIALHFGGKRIVGDAMITAAGIEGGGVYALSPDLREALSAGAEAVLHIDLAPGLTEAALVDRLAKPRGKRTLSNWLRKQTGLVPAAIGLLQEAARADERNLAAMSSVPLAALVKAVPIRLAATAPIDRAISTAGGVRFSEIDAAFMLKRRPGTFVAGEMLDWEAPTGGYLLQAVFATGAAAGRGALAWLNERSE